MCEYKYWSYRSWIRRRRSVHSFSNFYFPFFLSLSSHQNLTHQNHDETPYIFPALLKSIFLSNFTSLYIPPFLFNHLHHKQHHHETLLSILSHYTSLLLNKNFTCFLHYQSTSTTHISFDFKIFFAWSPKYLQWLGSHPRIR